ncbi:hypothetical protein QFC21_001876 [Naganishia friedmannii]|uniref:Uncharacterized protein n=1 Tax=Naganishia friedmannii TaxID=89922 RepID=A0ACC2W184_9TREE|nr:hypothetical protein QFC21_001876 [Naganishia friedmannii]
MARFEATVSAPVNIACINASCVSRNPATVLILFQCAHRYWGKRNTALILPTNSSLSVTLSQDHLRSTTTSSTSEGYEQGDRLWLNGKEEEITKGGRTEVCLAALRKWRREVEEKDSTAAKMSEWPLRIASFNNFPTAAGLASSASGLAALVYSVSQLYVLPQTPSQLSLIARQGSGSACRSLFGGFVAWEMGQRDDGADSLAVQVAERDHWPEMHALICVVSDAKKGTSSTSGMQKTVATSTLLQHRINHVVPDRMSEISRAIAAKDFNGFASITMRDSNSFHAVCLDTAPPIFYLNDVSRAIIAVVEEMNRASLASGGGLLAAYTFDAGPNAVIYALEENMPMIVSTINEFFPQTLDFPDPFNMLAAATAATSARPQGFNNSVVREGGWEKGAVSRLIHTCVGDGPRRLSDEEGLLTVEGVPKTLA